MEIINIIIGVLCVLIIVTFLMKNKPMCSSSHIINTKKEGFENFDGVSYVDDYKLTNCCNLYGCNSFQCQYFLNQRQSPMVVVGVIINRRKIYSLYRRYNVDTKLYEYFYLDKKDSTAPVYVKIETDGSELMSKDIIKIDNEKFIVQIHNMNSQIMNNYQYYNPVHTFPRYNKDNNIYTNRIIKPIVGPSGVLVSLDGKRKYVVIQQVLNPQRQIYNYLVNINDNLIQLPSYRRFEENEIIRVPELGEKFKYIPDNRDTYFI
jgi:hypothetical protein